jgi:DNA-binding response OmpR family regulator
MLEERDFDLLLLDSQIADLDGNKLPELDIPIVALTGNSSGAQASALRMPGIRDSISKPVDIQNLLAMLARSLPKRADAERQFHL